MATQEDPNWSPPRIEPSWWTEALWYNKESMDLKVRSEFTFWLQPLTSQSPNLTETQFSCTSVMRIGWDIKSSVIPETINHYVHKTNGVRLGHSLYTKKEEWLR